MRIGVNLLYYRPGEVGGSETYVRNVLERLARTGDDVVAFCWGGAVDELRAFRVRPVEVFRATASRAARLRHLIASLPSACRRERVDVVWSPANFAVPFGLDVPQVATIHDLQHEQLPEAFGLATRIYRTVAFRNTVRRCGRLIAISEFTRRGVIEAYAADPDKTVVVHHGAGGTVHPEPGRRAEVRARLALPQNFFFYPAALWPHKNHETLLAALALARRRSALDLRVVLSGAAMTRESWLRSRIRAHGLERSVMYLGFISAEEVRAVMGNAVALVFPSRFEGFGLPPLEAMEHSVPVLASSAASIPEVVGNAAVLVDPGDVEEWAEALVRLWTDADLRADLVTRGRANLARFSWDRCAHETRRIIADCVSDSSSGAATAG